MQPGCTIDGAAQALCSSPHRELVQLLHVFLYRFPGWEATASFCVPVWSTAQDTCSYPTRVHREALSGPVTPGEGNHHSDDRGLHKPTCPWGLQAHLHLPQPQASELDGLGATPPAGWWSKGSASCSYSVRLVFCRILFVLSSHFSDFNLELSAN